jgi:LacI family transcriptional regulator
VLEAVAALGYAPNIAARRLAASKSASIGLIYSGGHSPFLDAILLSALKATAARGLLLHVRQCDWTSAADAAAVADELLLSEPAGLLLIPPFAELLSGARVLEGVATPVAAIATGGPMPNIDTVRIDNRAAMHAMTQLVIDQGHSRIGFIAGPARHTDSVKRLDGYRDALSDNGLPCPYDLIANGVFTFASGLDAADQLLDLAKPPTAILASNDDMAAGVMWAAHRRGLKIPRDLAVTGFDDTSLATKVWPALTVIRQPISQMTEMATELLLKRLQNGPFASAPQDIVLNHALIERGSTARRPTDLGT